jgi:hypothetical protein
MNSEQNPEEALRFALGKLATDDDPLASSGQQFSRVHKKIYYNEF